MGFSLSGAIKKVGGGLLGGGMLGGQLGGLVKSPFTSMPKAPNPTNLANTQLGYNKDAAFGSLINQSGPFGSLNYTKNPDGSFTANTSLDPSGSAAIGGARSGSASMLADFLGGGDGRQKAEDALYRRHTSRLDPEWGERERATLSRLETQGITQGSKAYQDAVDRMERDRRASYDDARTSSILGGSAERSARLGEVGSMFNLGQLFNQPQAVTHAGIGAPDFMGAATGNYQARLNAASAENMGRAQLLGGLLGGGMSLLGG